MNTEPANDPESPAADGDPSASALSDQLRNDVTSWMAARTDSTARDAAERNVATARKPAPKAATRTKSAKPVPEPSQPIDVKKKPFGMSYDGMSQADYITYMISRGAR